MRRVGIRSRPPSQPTGLAASEPRGAPPLIPLAGDLWGKEIYFRDAVVRDVPVQSHRGMSGWLASAVSRHKYLLDKDPSSPTQPQEGKQFFPSWSQPRAAGEGAASALGGSLKFFGREAG